MLVDWPVYPRLRGTMQGQRGRNAGRMDEMVNAVVPSRWGLHAGLREQLALIETKAAEIETKAAELSRKAFKSRFDGPDRD